MRFPLLALIAVVILITPIQNATAQSATMPLPGLVIKDADGKVMGQVAGFITDTSLFPFIALNVDGNLAYLFFRTYGLVDRVASGASGVGGPTVYFSNSDCMGDTYVNPVSDTGLERWSGKMFGVAGPDPITGEYKLYRSMTMTATLESLSSKWEGGICENYGPVNRSVLVAEEVIPNPLAGFHGPTTAQPERILTISGGDRLP